MLTFHIIAFNEGLDSQDIITFKADLRDGHSILDSYCSRAQAVLPIAVVCKEHRVIGSAGSLTRKNREGLTPLDFFITSLEGAV